MPTPESEAFKAKKPTVAPTFDGVDFSDNEAVWNARDAIIREQWVQQMMARLVRDELGTHPRFLCCGPVGMPPKIYRSARCQHGRHRATF